MGSSVYVEGCSYVCLDKETQEHLKEISSSLRRIAESMDHKDLEEKVRQEIHDELYDKMVKEMVVRCPVCKSEDMSLIKADINPERIFKNGQWYIKAHLYCNACKHIQEVLLNADSGWR